MYNLQSQPLSYKSYTGRIRQMYQQPVTQVSTALILTLITIAFFGFAAIRPTLATVSELIAELEQKRELDQQISDKLSTLASLQDQYAINKNRLQVFDRVLPPNHQLEDLLLQLEYLAHTNQVQLSYVQVNPLTLYGTPDPKNTAITTSELDPNYSKLSLSLSLMGDPEQINRFVTAANSLDRIFRLQTVSLSRDPEEPEAAPATAHLELQAFYQPEATDAIATTNQNPAPTP